MSFSCRGCLYYSEVRFSSCENCNRRSSIKETDSLCEVCDDFQIEDMIHCFNCGKCHTSQYTSYCEVCDRCKPLYIKHCEYCDKCPHNGFFPGKSRDILYISQKHSCVKSGCLKKRV